MSGKVDEGLRRRDMVCMAPGKSTDCACMGCMHRAVHYEMLNCKDRCENTDVEAAHRCEPVSEVNHGRDR